MAAEVQRVGRRYFVQTPNRRFPIEPHFLMPLFQWWPESLRAKTLTHMPLGWLPRAESYESALATVRSIRLLSGREVQSLFPKSRIYRERLFGLTKSFVAISD